MHLSRLSTAEMLPLSASYLNPNHPAHQALIAVPELNSLLPRLRAAHQMLYLSETPEEKRASALERAVIELDIEHHDLVHGIDGLCRSLAFLAEDDDTRARWQRMHELIVPTGSKMARLPYHVEAVNATLLQQILEGLPSADKKVLRAQLVGPRSFYEIIERWIAVGKELGQKADELRRMPAAPMDSALQDARRNWMRVVGAMVALMQMAELLGETPPGIREYVLGPLRAATERATPRRPNPEQELEDDEEPGQSPGPAPELAVGGQPTDGFVAEYQPAAG